MPDRKGTCVARSTRASTRLLGSRKAVLKMKCMTIIQIFSQDAAWRIDREDHCNGYPVYSGLFVCPICCRIWAKLSIESGEYKLFHEARTIPCEKHPEGCHPDLRPFAGSLLDNPSINGWDTELLRALPA